MGIPFSNLNLKYRTTPVEVPVPGTEHVLQVVQYLPQAIKGDFLKFVMDSSFDDRTGFYSPLRLETYFMLALAQWYGQIDISEKELMDAPDTYDKLQLNGVLDLIIHNIPEGEYKFMEDLVDETAMGIQQYNTSAAGILTSMSSDADNLNEQLNNIMGSIKDKKGIEDLLNIRDVMKDELAPKISPVKIALVDKKNKNS